MAHTAKTMHQQQQPQLRTALPSADADTLPTASTVAATPVARTPDTTTDLLQATATKPYHIVPDLYRGIVLGAYALDDLHGPGMVAWIAAGFVPGLGTIAALRDGFYSFEVREWGAFLLNLVGLVPFMKGFTNVLDRVLARRLHYFHRMAHVSHQVSHVARHRTMVRAGSQGAAQVVTGGTHEAGAIVLAVKQDAGLLHNRFALPAVLLALVTAVVLLPQLGTFLAIGFIDAATSFSNVISLPVAVSISIVGLLWSLGVLALSLHARSTAKRLKGQAFSRGIVSAMALWLAWFDLLASVIIGITVIYLIVHSLLR
jgi:hypothetical protein